MIKLITTLAAAALVAAAVVILPGISAEVSANVPDRPGEQQMAAKADRLMVPTLGATCLPKAWPYFDRDCLFEGRWQGETRPVRMISTDRLDTPSQ